MIRIDELQLKRMSGRYFLSVIHGRQALIYANIWGYGSKYLRWVSYVNCIMHVYHIYQERCLYVDFVASGSSS